MIRVSRDEGQDGLQPTHALYHSSRSIAVYFECDFLARGRLFDIASFLWLYSKLLTAMTHKYATMSFLKKYQITLSLETKMKLGRYLSSPIWRAFCVRRWHISASSSRWFGHHQIDFHSCNTIRATPFDDTFNYMNIFVQLRVDCPDMENGYMIELRRHPFLFQRASAKRNKCSESYIWNHQATLKAERWWIREYKLKTALYMCIV